MRVELKAAVEARVVVAELKPGARQRALALDSDRQPEAIARGNGQGREVKRDVDLGPAVGRPGRLRVGEVGRVPDLAQVRREGVDRLAEAVQMALEQPNADLARVGGAVDGLRPEVELAGAVEDDIGEPRGDGG